MVVKEKTCNHFCRESFHLIKVFNVARSLVTLLLMGNSADQVPSERSAQFFSHFANVLYNRKSTQIAEMKCFLYRDLMEKSKKKISQRKIQGMQTGLNTVCF